MNLNQPPGNFMVADSHMDCTFRSDSNDPEIRSHSIFHNPSLIQLAKSSAKKLKQEINTGTYCWTLGPCYETPAEIENMRDLGGDAVGMSTVPEIVTAAKLGIKTLTLSCLTNYAAGIARSPLSHQEVVTNARKFDKNFSDLIIEIIKKIDQEI